jgi:uncharacterized membrane protein
MNNETKNAASGASVRDNRGFKVVRTVTINRPRHELYAFWKNFENLPRFMKHLKAVKIKDSRFSHWEASAPAGRTVSWEAEIINERENELIAWRSREGSDIDNAGSVRFKDAPARRGTEVTVALEYVPPAGILGKTIAKWLGEDPEVNVSDDLRRFKAMMETGEIPTIEGQPAGRPE